MIVNNYKIEPNVNLRGANLYEADLRRADLRRAYLYGANLRGADLHGIKGIMSFNGEKDLLVYFYHDNEHYFKIGCKTLPSKDWLKYYKKIGKENKYTNDQIELYGSVIKLFSKYDLSEV